MNVKTKAVIGIVLALVIGFFLFGGTSQAVTTKPSCSVVNTTVTEESLTAGYATEPHAWRYVRTETLRCGPKKYTDIVTYGKYQKSPIFRSNP